MKCVYKERDWLIILSYHRDDVLIILSVILIILGYIGLGLVDQAWWVGVVFKSTCLKKNLKFFFSSSINQTQIKVDKYVNNFASNFHFMKPKEATVTERWVK